MTPAESLVVVQRRFLDVLAERDEARALLREVAVSGVEHVGSRYITVQIDPETWQAVLKAGRATVGQLSYPGRAPVINLDGRGGDHA